MKRLASMLVVIIGLLMISVSSVSAATVTCDLYRGTLEGTVGNRSFSREALFAWYTTTWNVDTDNDENSFDFYLEAGRPLREDLLADSVGSIIFASNEQNFDLESNIDLVNMGQFKISSGSWKGTWAWYATSAEDDLTVKTGRNAFTSNTNTYWINNDPTDTGDTTGLVFWRTNDQMTLYAYATFSGMSNEGKSLLFDATFTGEWEDTKTGARACSVEVLEE